MTLQERKEYALSLRSQGYNCGQVVTMAMADILPEGISAESIERLSSGLGGGIGGCQLTCGCITGSAMIEGAVGYDNPRAKASLYKQVGSLAKAFVDRQGSASCKELKTVLRRDCTNLILDTVEMLHNRYAQ